MGPVLRVDRIRPGAVVILYLRDPKERFWGVLRSLDATGVSVLGLELNSFEDWLRQEAVGSRREITPSLVFYPLVRVEKILLDAPSGDVPALVERFEERVGKDLLTYLGLPEGA
jgi:hypothetical protein